MTSYRLDHNQEEPEGKPRRQSISHGERSPNSPDGCDVEWYFGIQEEERLSQEQRSEKAAQQAIGESSHLCRPSAEIRISANTF